MLVAVLGGLLGILMMIPLRRALIVKQHGMLKYPEGTACAEVLIVGEQGGASAARRSSPASAIALRLPSALDAGAVKLWPSEPSSLTRTAIDGGFKAGGRSRAEISPELLGVGYIIGPRIAVDHVRRRRAGVPGADPGDQVLRRAPPDRCCRPATDADRAR